MGDLPQPRHHHSVAFLRGRVYLAGITKSVTCYYLPCPRAGGADPGDDDVKGSSVVVDTMWSFDPVERCWRNEKGMNFARKNFGLVAANQSLYALGGQDKDGR